MNHASKRTRLQSLLRDMGSVVVGYSGGVDSVLLAKVATDTLGADRVLAVTGRSPSLASWMEDTAADVARRFGIPWLEIDTHEIEDPNYVSNPSNRCYFCKAELWERLHDVAAEHGFAVVCDGANADDVGDHRPGTAAGAERGVRSPMLEAGLNKEEIRIWSYDLGLPTWDQPAAPCLASRIPYGLAVTPERLRQVEAAELALRGLGFRDFRVRHHDSLARLEIHAAEQDRVPRCRERILRGLLEVGFSRAAVDLDGYRRGALNEALVQLDGARAPGNSANAVDAAAEPGLEVGSGEPLRSAVGGVASAGQPPTSAVATSRAELDLGGTGAALESAGHEAEVGVIRVPQAVWDENFRLAGELSRSVRRRGFRYAALDLEPAAPPAGG